MVAGRIEKVRLYLVLSQFFCYGGVLPTRAWRSASDLSAPLFLNLLDDDSMLPPCPLLLFCPPMPCLDTLP
ncbi:hypothetical protein Despr_0724 [Desulfobulbus propionicus DSM 2032]|jgi:hypothetical protein|uniref:Uncharacterized protein n=1 Tax=Desulfobulbus propionicus (strain ATCC 33891 / DSM 2032 / VKM B-1956 / 1pr3) TaxID=577650 RepID=A0A7U4DND0_DESPD|nr:hypothetical protein Despr_0724 [Desulfobulbus propionicus DSM 2032]